MRALFDLVETLKPTEELVISRAVLDIHGLDYEVRVQLVADISAYECWHGETLNAAAVKGLAERTARAGRRP